MYYLMPLALAVPVVLVVPPGPYLSVCHWHWRCHWQWQCGSATGNVHCTALAVPLAASLAGGKYQ